MNEIPRHGAIISDDQRYRYTLTRWFYEFDFGATGDVTNRRRHLPFLMHNGSTADALEDDHTILKCCGFAQRLGYGGIIVGNLYGARARDPKALFDLADPIGPDNDLWLAHMFATLPSGGQVIVAWGTLKGPGKDARIRAVVAMAESAGVTLKALRVSPATNTPNHPLMLPYSCTPVPWRLEPETN